MLFSGRSAPIETPAPGVHQGVPEHIYRAWDAVNQSALWTFRRSPAHARYEFLNPKASSTTKLGSAIHTVLLEPDSLEQRYAVRPPGIDGRTKEGMAKLAAFRAEAGGRIILEDRDDYETLLGVRDALSDHPLAYTLITSPGFTELSAVWDDLDHDVRGKMRADRVVKHGGWTWVIDVKSTDDASRWGFRRSVEKFGYYMQAAYYLDGLDWLAVQQRRFAFIAVEKKPPYAVALYEPDQFFIDEGRDEYRRHLKTWKQCQESGLWPGYPDSIEPLEPSEGFKNRVLAKEAA